MPLPSDSKCNRYIFHSPPTILSFGSPSGKQLSALCKSRSGFASLHSVKDPVVHPASTFSFHSPRGRGSPSRERLRHHHRCVTPPPLALFRARVHRSTPPPSRTLLIILAYHRRHHRSPPFGRQTSNYARFREGKDIVTCSTCTAHKRGFCSPNLNPPRRRPYSAGAAVFLPLPLPFPSASSPP